MADERIRPGADDEAPVPGVLGGGGGTVATVPPPPPVAPAPKVLGGTGGPGATGTVIPFPPPKPAPTAPTTPDTPQWITDKLNAWNKTAPEAPVEPATPPPLGAETSRNWRIAQAWAEEEALRRYSNQPKVLEATIRAIRLQAQIEEAKEEGDKAQTAAAERIDRDNANRAHTHWLQEIEKGMGDPRTNWIGMQHSILTDPVLEKFPEHIDHLKKEIQEITGQTQSFGQGPKYDDYNSRVTSAPGTPGHIYDSSEIMRIPDSEVTPKGKNRLFENYLKSQKEDGRIIEENRQSILNGMKLRVVRPETAFTRDYQGEQAFDLRIRPAYNLAYDRWRQAHPDKSPFEFFQDTKLQDDIIEWGYPKAIKDINDKAAEGEEQGAIAAQRGITPAMQTRPAVPPGYNTEAWNRLVIGVPVSARTGKPWTLQNWAGYLQDLHDHPTAEHKRNFDATFGKQLNTTADQVLRDLDKPAPERPERQPGFWGTLGGYLEMPRGGGELPGYGIGPVTPPAPGMSAPEIRRQRIEGLTQEIEKYRRQGTWEFIPLAARTASREHADKLQAELDQLIK